jgi:integrase/recombinase XerD
MPRLADRAKLDRRVHPHAFRHTYAIELVREGADLVQVSELLGHARVQTTIDYLRPLVARGELRRLIASRPSWDV